MMVDLEPPFHETLRRVVDSAIKAQSKRDLPFNTADVARMIGVAHGDFKQFMQPDNPKRLRYCPAQVIPALCRVLQSDEVLDVLERDVNRVGFRPEGGLMDLPNRDAALAFSRDIGSAVQTLSDTLLDHVVEKGELQNMLAAFDVLIRDSSGLRIWLAQQHQESTQTQRKQSFMADISPPFREQLQRVVSDSMKAQQQSDRAFTTAHIAAQLGLDGERTFQYYLNPNEEKRRCPARVIPTLCRVLGNYKILDIFEREVGRVAFRPLAVDSSPSADLRAVNEFHARSHQAVSDVINSLEDGRISYEELHATTCALEDLIRECAALRQCLIARQRPASDGG